jgi:hypothetical protein
VTLPISADVFCGYAFEESEGQHLMVLLPDGTLSVYDVKSAWDLVVSQKFVLDMLNCTDVEMVAGFGQAFIMTGWNNKMYGINMMHMLHGKDLLEVSETTFTFQPYSAVVAGVPQDVRCRLSDDHDEHDHEEDDGMENEPVAPTSGHPRSTAALSLLGLITAAAMAAM